MVRHLSGALAIALGTIGLAAQGCGSDAPATDGSSSGGSSGSFNVGDGGLLGDGSTACATDTKKAEKQPVDMVIGLDTSFSMDFDSKWANVRDALKAFASNPAYADLGVGLQFFPIRKQCSVADYQVPAVPLGLQPQAAGPIAAALDAQQMAGGTPMVPLLEGLTKYLAANAKPGRKPVIVLATDGVPDDTCLSSENGSLPNTLENAVAVADGALKGTPSIATFVIGVGGELTALNAIAVAGGTGSATLVDTGGNAQQALLAALDNVRRKAIPCDYDIPPGTIDPQSTNVTYTSAGSTRQLVFVGNEASCAKAPDGAGWYFDDEAAPKKVVLCKAMCESVKGDDSGSVDLVFGCPRVGVK
ncbi:MAG TPA: vWA domain-containing protein [Labilithrix sp.]|nr:vWA domain-containing protein [Labilithrix sp.]